MADEKKSGEAKDNNIPDLSDFLKEKGLLKYKDTLIEAGLEEDLESLKELDDDDIDALIKNAELKKFHGRVLKRIIKEYQDGKYKPGQQKILNALREGRKDLRGVIPRKLDTFTGQKGKTVIFIGQTGVGKTTFINSMCNYLEQISYEEQFRYKLICEENDKKVDTKDPTKSQTQDITTYYLEHLPAIDSAINIVDTPGFGDTEGPKKDMIIRDQFKKFFETKCPFIDGIYFIVKASDTRVGVVQQYIFNMVLDLFGKDVKKNIFIIFTFADGSTPPALEAVKKLGIEYANEFRINNSGFNLADATTSSDIHENFFDVGMKQFKIIFEELSKVTTKSTEQTKQTLRERDNITKGLEDITKNLKLQLDEIEAEKKTCEAIKTHEKAINANKGGTITIETSRPVTQKNESKTNNLNCDSCKKTCCTNCGAISMGWCGAFGWFSGCTVCSNCGKSAHKYSKHVWETKLVTYKETTEDMAKKLKLKLAQGEKITAQKLYDGVQKHIKELEKQTQAIIQNMKKSVERLKEIALNPKAIGDSEYFDFLIKAEMQNQESGWQTRVDELEMMKNNIQKAQDIINAKDNKQIQQKLLNDEKSNKNQ